MSDRERIRPPEDRPAGSGAAASSNIGATGAAVARLLAAADQAINTALSADSEAFLRENRQEGGE